jgi:hypothetical protein
MQTPSTGERTIGLYQRMLRHGAGLTLLGSAALVSSGAAEADQYDQARSRHPELFKVYYEVNVLEYCGLLTHESALGFVMQRDDLLARRPLSKDEVREVRVAGAIAADTAYGSHGLAQSAWCNGEGRDAYNRFVARYRATPYGTVDRTE